MGSLVAFSSTYGCLRGLLLVLINSEILAKAELIHLIAVSARK